MAQEPSAADPILDIPKKAYDWVQKHLGDPSKSASTSSKHDDAIKEMNKQANAKRTAEASKSFQTKTETPAKTTARKPVKRKSAAYKTQ